MKRGASVIGLIAALVGVPTVLLGMSGGPTLPSFNGIRMNDTYMPVDPILKALALLAWLVWVYVAVVVVLRTLAVLTLQRSGRAGTLLSTSTRLTPRPLRMCIDLAVGGLLLAATMSPRATATTVDRVGPVQPIATTPAKPKADPGTAKPLTKMYRVRPGDSLWRIAERELGNGFKWREIFALNDGRHFEDGRSLRDPRLIFPGWQLRLPTEVEASQIESRPMLSGSATSVRPTLHVVDTPSAERPTKQEAPRAQAIRDNHAPSLRAPSSPVLRLPSGVAVPASFAGGLLTAELLGRLRGRRKRRVDQPVADISAWEKEPTLVRDIRRTGTTPGVGKLDVALESLTDTWRRHTGAYPSILAAVEGDREVTVLLEGTDAPLPAKVGGGIGPETSFERLGAYARVVIKGPFPPQPRSGMNILQRGFLVPVGSTRGQAVHAGALGLGGISVEGTFAEPLVRQMTMSLAVQAEPDELKIFIIGASSLGIEGLPHVERTADWAEGGELLQDIQIDLLRRARTIEIESEQIASRTDELLPAFALVTTAPPSSMRGVVEAVASESRNLGGVLFAVGWRPERTSLHVVANETTLLETDLPIPAQLKPFLLDEQGAADAICVIQHAYERATDQGLGSAHELSEAPAPASTDEPLDRPSDPTIGVAPVTSRDDLSTSASDLEVRCLGQYQLLRRGEVFIEGLRTKSRELLAYLVAHPKGAPRERIIEELWSGTEPRRGLKLFELAVSFLRTHVRGDNALRYVEKIGDSYRLQPDAWSIDAWEFERLLNEATQESESDQVQARLRRALALYEGEFCDDAYYEWVGPVRERYRALFVRGCGQLAEILAEEDRHEEALLHLDQAIVIEPLCEDLWRNAMLSEAALGRTAVAVDRYNKLRALLAEELEVEPDPETQRIRAQLESPHRTSHAKPTGNPGQTAAI